MTNFELIINIAIIVLLLLTIVYVWRLNRNLSVLRQNQESMFSLAQTLNEASTKAQNAVTGLKTAAAQTASELEAVVSEAKKAKEDLSFLNKKAETFDTEAYEERYTSLPSAQDRLAKASAKIARSSAQEDDEKSEAEIELLKALRSIR